MLEELGVLNSLKYSNLDWQFLLILYKKAALYYYLIFDFK